MQEREQGQQAAEERHDRDRAERGGARRPRGRGDADDRLAVAHGAGQPERGHHAEPAEEDRRVVVHGVDLDDRRARGRVPRRPGGYHHGEQEDRVDDKPAQLAGGEREERGPADDRFRTSGRERRGHDATCSAGWLSGSSLRSSRYASSRDGSTWSTPSRTCAATLRYRPVPVRQETVAAGSGWSASQTRPMAWRTSSVTWPSYRIRPRSSTMTRSHRAATSSVWWVDRTTIDVRAISASTVRNVTRCSGSTPVVGSSRISTGGDPSSACASATRRRWPPDMARIRFVATSDSPTWSSTRRTSACRAAGWVHSLSSAM